MDNAYNLDKLKYSSCLNLRKMLMLRDINLRNLICGINLKKVSFEGKKPSWPFKITN